MTIKYIRLFVRLVIVRLKTEYAIRLYHILRQNCVFCRLFVERAKILFFFDYNTEFVRSAINRNLFFG